MTRNRLWFAAVIAPSATALMMLMPHMAGLLSASMRLVLSATLVASYGLSYTIGIPIYLYARRHGWRTAFQYVGGAFLMGFATWPVFCAIMLIYAVFFAPYKLREGVPMLLDMRFVGGAIVFGLLAMPIGWLFWLITRPDRFD
jgi:hypothetical protein